MGAKKGERACNNPREFPLSSFKLKGDHPPGDQNISNQGGIPGSHWAQRGTLGFQRGHWRSPRKGGQGRQEKQGPCGAPLCGGFHKFPFSGEISRFPKGRENQRPQFPRVGKTLGFVGEFLQKGPGENIRATNGGPFKFYRGLEGSRGGGKQGGVPGLGPLLRKGLVPFWRENCGKGPRIQELSLDPLGSRWIGCGLEISRGPFWVGKKLSSLWKF